MRNAYWSGKNPAVESFQWFCFWGRRVSVRQRRVRNVLIALEWGTSRVQFVFISQAHSITIHNLHIIQIRWYPTDLKLYFHCDRHNVLVLNNHPNLGFLLFYAIFRASLARQCDWRSSGKNIETGKRAACRRAAQPLTDGSHSLQFGWTKTEKREKKSCT